MANFLGVSASNEGDFYFISYSSKDCETVSKYVEQLSRYITLWYDDGIRSSQNWKTAIAQNIKNSKAVIMFISKNTLANEDSYVSDEYEIAKMYQKPIHIVILDEIKLYDVPDCFALWWVQINKLQCIEAFRFETAEACTKKLLKAFGIETKSSSNIHYDRFIEFTQNVTKNGYKLTEKPLYGYNGQTAENLFIEGEENTALFLLSPKYARKVQLMFVDTARYAGSSFSHSHTEEEIKDVQDRLFRNIILSKELLNEDGLLIVMTDMNNLMNYKSFCDSILGETNFVGMITLEHTGRISFNKIGVHNEYMLIYCPNCKELKRLEEYATESDEYRLLPAVNLQTLSISRKGNYYPLYIEAAANRISTTPFEGAQELYPLSSNGTTCTWRFSKGKMEQLANEGLLCVKTTNGNLRLYKKEKIKKQIKTNWNSPQYEPHHAIREIRKIVPDFEFSAIPFYFHSATLMRDIFEIFLPRDGLVLDTCAGLGASAQAVMSLNQQDGGERKYILIQKSAPLTSPILLNGREFTNSSEYCEEIIKQFALYYSKDGKTNTGFKHLEYKN
ncbi:MAG: toll/interleukin-1 receptor domain-containing protein [Ruminococcaceae bacterium]|nr:toll/interleukin-1 receptor domain-containing protein [Oscillospiraceae bacterium]